MGNVIRNIRIGGVTNIAQMSVPLEALTALVAPNNYGKSNVLQGVEFAVRFMTATPQERRQMMAQRTLIPINASMDCRPFEFEISGTTDDYDYEYGYRFEWATTKEGLTGQRITGEWLRAKGTAEPTLERMQSQAGLNRGSSESHLSLLRDGRVASEEGEANFAERGGGRRSQPKYRSLLKRDGETEALMAPTPTSRCSKPLTVDGSTLALDRLSGIDKLFFAPLVGALQRLSVQRVNTLDNPDGIFSTPYPATGTALYSTAMPRSGETGYFINSLRRLAPDRYELLRSTLLQLIPGIEDFEPVQVDLSERADVPFQMPNTYYDIRVKERHNNQYTSINSVSTGCKKILWVLTTAMAASMNGVQLLMFEELENSVHPRLLQSLLQVVDTLAGDTKVITTSHSPFLVRYLRPERIYLGLPTPEGVADFRTIRPSKVKKVLQLASGEDTSVGEYLFEMMLDAEADQDMLDEYFVR